MTEALTRTTFRTSRLLDFCSRKELVAQTGHREELWPLVVLKELVDNGLDACEDAGIAPVLDVVVDDRGITVSDNGPGIPSSTIDGVLDFSVRVSNREAYVAPDRGAQGNALKTIVAMPFVLDGERGEVTITTGSTTSRITLTVDRIRQEPVVSRVDETADARFGTSVTVEWPDSARSQLDATKARFLQLASDFATLNPHLTINVAWRGERFDLAATDAAWSKWRPSNPTAPTWYTPERLERLVAAYVAHDAESGRQRSVREFVAEFRGLSATAKQKAIGEATGLSRSPLTGLVRDGAIDRDLVTVLLDAMKANSRPVKPADLGVIGRQHLTTRLLDRGADPESVDYRKREGETDGVPWLVETAFGWLGDDSEGDRVLVSGVNWSPGIVNPFRELGRYGTSLDSILEQQRAGRREPVVLVLHMACPRVDYTDRGKSAVVVGGRS